MEGPTSPQKGGFGRPFSFDAPFFRSWDEVRDTGWGDHRAGFAKIEKDSNLFPRGNDR